MYIMKKIIENMLYHISRHSISTEKSGVAKNNINGYNRIYHYHIRKTGGTSLNKMFFSIGNTKEELFNIYSEVCNSINHVAVDREGKIYVGYNNYAIEKGDYFYGFSHIPMHLLKIPEKTFTFTIIRDPIDRILSHYKMLLSYKRGNDSHASFDIEKDWVMEGFSGFIERVPAKHLMRQLYMFSSNFNIEEALINISKCSHIIFMDDFENGVAGLFKKLGMDVPGIYHEKKNDIILNIKDEELFRLKENISKELIFYEKLKNIYNNL